MHLAGKSVSTGHADEVFVQAHQVGCSIEILSELLYSNFSDSLVITLCKFDKVLSVNSRALAAGRLGFDSSPIDKIPSRHE